MKYTCFEIERVCLYGTDNEIVCDLVTAESPAEALEKAGFAPDDEDSRCSGAEPRNEYGHPWYPHYRANPL
jgi:hypothetical protein